MCWVCQHRHRIPSCPQDCFNSKWQTFNKVPGTFVWDSGQYILHSHCTFVNRTPSLSVFLSITSCRLCWFEIRWRWHQWGPVRDVRSGDFLLESNNVHHFAQNQNSCCIIQESAVSSASLQFNVNAPSIPMISHLESRLHIIWIPTSFCCFSFLLLVPYTQQTHNKQSWNFHWALFTEQISSTVLAASPRRRHHSQHCYRCWS